MDKLGHTVEEGSEILGIGRSKTYQEIRSGRLKARKIGRLTRLFPEDLHAYARSLPSKVTTRVVKKDRGQR